MKKREVKAALARYDYTMIPKSWYRGKKEDRSVIFNAYDDMGNCYHFYVNFKDKRALRQFLALTCVLEPQPVSFMFWEGGDK